MILCALLCMHVSYGYPADVAIFHDAGGSMCTIPIMLATL